MSGNILNIKNLHVNIKNKSILENINFELYEGEVLGIIGVSGSGKSVLLKTISGFFKPKGEIYSEQKNLLKEKKFLKKLIGFSTQEDSIYVNLTVKENIEYFGRLYGLKKKTIKERSERLIELLELEEFKNQVAKQLSGGTSKRLNMACSLIHKPRILLLDEPISGLDPKLRENVLSLVNEIRKKGTTIIITSHFINEIEPFCDRVGIIHRGKIVALDSPINLREHFSNTYEIKIRSYPGKYDKIYKVLKRKVNITNAFLKNNELVLHAPKKYTINDYAEYITKILEINNEYTIKIDVSQSPLEEIFRIVTKNVP